MNFPVKIFIVYAHADAAYKDALIKALSPFKNQGWIESWHDGNIQPGQIWDEQIQQNLQAADVVLPLVSSDFFASDYIQQVEIRHAFARFEAGECAIVPVLVRDCAWKADQRLVSLQMLPKGGKPIDSWLKPDEAYTSVVAGIHQLIEAQPDKVAAVFPQDIEPAPIARRFWQRYQWPLIMGGILAITLAIYAVQISVQKTHATPPEVATPAADEQAFLGLKIQPNIPKTTAFLTQYPQSSRATQARQLLADQQNEFNRHLQSARVLYQAKEKKEAIAEFEKARHLDSIAPEIIDLQRKLMH